MSGTNYTNFNGRRAGQDNITGRLFAEGEPYTVAMEAADGGLNITEVTMTVQDYFGKTLAGVFNMEIWLSDATTGAGLTATTASGAVAAKTSSGADLAVLTTKKALLVQTLATGLYTLSITDTAKTAFKVCARVPGKAATVVGITLASGDYG